MRLSAVSLRRLGETSAVNDFLFSNIFKQYTISTEGVGS